MYVSHINKKASTVIISQKDDKIKQIQVREGIQKINAINVIFCMLNVIDSEFL